MRAHVLKAALGAVAGLSVSLAMAPTAGAAFAGANGEIAFERAFRIWTKPPSLAATETKWREDAVTDGSPVYSPDGLRVAFFRRTPGPEIFVGDADGTGPVHRLTTNTVAESELAWSPDGTRLAFQSGGQIWVMNANGSAQREISVAMPGDSPAFDPEQPSLSPAWSPPLPGSPDGRIAFIHGGFLWTMDPTGVDKKALPHTCATPNGICDPAEAEPAWSPTGRDLSFSYYGNLYLLPLASGTTVPLLVTEEGERYPGSQTDSSWSPDGRFILFESAPPAGVPQVAIARSTGTDLAPRLLTDDSGANPSWQPKPVCTNEGATAGSDVIVGTTGADVLCGLGGRDTIDGGRGADIVFGGPGPDRVNGGLGNDVLDGGPGGDTVDYALAGRGVRASLMTEFATGDGYDVLLGLERIDGSPFADTLTGALGANVLRGLGGADALEVRDGVSGNDTATGGGGSDVCHADAGDRLVGCP